MNTVLQNKLKETQANTETKQEKTKRYYQKVRDDKKNLKQKNHCIDERKTAIVTRK